MVEITKGLVARRYSDEDIQKIIELNFLRVFREVCCFSVQYRLAMVCRFEPNNHISG